MTKQVSNSYCRQVSTGKRLNGLVTEIWVVSDLNITPDPAIYAGGVVGSVPQLWANVTGRRSRVKRVVWLFLLQNLKF